MVDRELTEIVDTAEEGCTVVSKLCGRLCITTGGVTLWERGGTDSKGGVHGRGGFNDFLQRSIGLVVLGGNISWERVSGLAMTAVMRAGFCICRRESAISIL